MEIETRHNAESDRDPERIRSRIEALLAELPGEAELPDLPAQTDLNQLAQRLEEAHTVLVRALESVEKG
ncbi:hypothetical protein KIH27_03170 [Mycobacterium sp. M1]|uniref:Uncharacterized protein n=1 Tax=Mycolicibacter acidiphilus TaxID=2835306 RepID=A0ABS5RG08_9MYCO|nr:hypothetical protein [Mycolicibacter acidiphilus]MBS9532584.1 hypothetical protein [Mycolicibacter acidiphilus]